MEMISLERKTNFFELKVSEYALATKIDDNDKAFEFLNDLQGKDLSWGRASETT